MSSLQDFDQPLFLYYHTAVHTGLFVTALQSGIFYTPKISLKFRRNDILIAFEPRKLNPRETPSAIKC